MLARVIVFEGDAQALGLFALTLDLFLTAEAIMRAAKLDQLFGIFFIHWQPLGLDIRAMFSADVRSLIMFQADRAQRVIDDIGGAFHQTSLVGVLDAKDEVSAFVLGNQVFE